MVEVSVLCFETCSLICICTNDGRNGEGHVLLCFIIQDYSDHFKRYVYSSLLHH